MKEKKIDAYTFEEFISAASINDRVAEIASELRQEYADRKPVFLVILNGAFIFASDLMRAYGEDCEVSFVKLSSYDGLQSTNKIKVDMPIQTDLSNKDVIIVEDIIDTGATLNKFLSDVKDKSPKSLKLVSFVVKPEAMKFDIPIDYYGFNIPNEFVIGYGLDYNEYGRELDSLYRLKS